MVKDKRQVALQVREREREPLHQIAALDLERVAPSALVSGMAFELQSLASGIANLADISMEMSVTSEGASLRFRAYSRRPGLV